MTAAIDWSGAHRQPCPACGRGPRDRALGVTINADGSGIARCFRCDFVQLLRDQGITQRAGAPIVRPEQQARHETLSEHGRELWRECGPLAGDAAAYLEARCCVVPPAEGHLRFHPALRHPPSGMVGPALVALVTDAVTREPLTLHRTWIQADGKKAPLDPPRMLLGGHRKAGGVVRLWPDEYVNGGLGIAEGIETALALAHAYQPCWAAIDAGNLGQLPALPGIECLTIAADHDDAGLAAADSCAARWHAARCRVFVVKSARPKQDIADLAAQEAA